jgi:hypothetical protein
MLLLLFTRGSTAGQALLPASLSMLPDKVVVATTADER